MKVLFIANCVPMRGGNYSLLQLMKELMQPPYNVEPLLLTTFDLDRYSSSIVKEAKALGIKCITARFYPFKWQEYNDPMSYVKYATNIINYPRILKIIEREKPDIIHSNSSIIDIGGYLSKKLNVRHIWHFREFGDLDFDMRPLFGARQEKRLYRNADAFIAVSQSVKNRYLPYIPESKIKVVYNGIPIKPFPSPAGKPEDGMVRFCISGAIEQGKRQMDAVKALDVLVNERKLTNVRLILIGDGDDRQRIERFSKEKQLTEYVSVTGWVSNVNDHYSQCDVGLTLSSNEGFGRTTVEFMRASLAVIASNTGANPEIIEDNVTGLLYPTGDIKALADMMQRLAEDSDLRKHLAKAAFSFSQTHFLSVDNTKAIFDTYLSLTN